MIFDRKTALKRLEGSERLLREVADIFCQQGPELINDLRAAAANRDFKSLSRAAHTLKGSADVLGGHKVAQVAQEIEHQASRQNPTADIEIIEELKQAVLDLIDELGQCVIASRDELEYRDRPHPESSSMTSAKLPWGHVLLAEDNSIVRIHVTELVKQLGCTCDVAVNGREAVEAVQKHKYDLLLLDCQMPEMDGFDTTEQIRRWEGDGTLPGHLPIVALTANTNPRDRERCLEAGMDDFLNKPVELPEFTRVVARFLGRKQITKKSEPARIEPEALLERCLGSLKFVDSLLNELETSGGKRIQAIRDQAELQDPQALADAAHSLKGAAGILCAKPLEEIAARIETAGRNGILDGMESLINELSSEMQRCLEGLPGLREDMRLRKERGK